MDRERFDALVRLCAASSSRRAALAALLGAGVFGAAAGAAPRKGKGKKRKARKRGGKGTNGKAKRAAVAAEATCAAPGPSSNLNGCNFNNRDLAGVDLSSSSMRGTRFRGADLCGADLSSSNLRDADFRGFAAPGNATDLTRANLRSSGCRGIRTNARTVFCNTIGCDGDIINPECDGCCADGDCPEGQHCDDGTCVPDCLTALTCCGFDEAECRARCCTGIIGSGLIACGEQFFCAVASPGGQCATDNDCPPLGECRDGNCCSFQNGICFSAADCCTAGATCDLLSCSA